MGSSRMGCEYRYRFSVEDELIPKNQWDESLGRRYVFEVRTNFIVKGRFENIDGGGGGIDEKVIGSEVFSVGFFDWEKEEENVRDVGLFVGNRLRDYWMSDDEVGEFIRKALSFAAVDKEKGRNTIPIGVNIVVCSVQQEGEPISATLDRAIKTECLYPTSLCPWIQICNDAGGGDGPDLCHMEVLRSELPTARVVDDGVMEECVVCLCRPTVGSQVTTLECGHAFHYHCIAKWLASKDTCPTCRLDVFAKHRQELLELQQ